MSRKEKKNTAEEILKEALLLRREQLEKVKGEM